LSIKDFIEINNLRIEAAFRHEKTDAIPIIIYASGPFLSRFVGIKTIEYYRDPKNMLNAQLAFRRRFYGLGILGPEYGVIVEPSAFGAKIIWRENEAPLPEPLLKKPEDIDKLEIPEPLTSGFIPTVVATYRYMCEKVKKEYVDPLSGALGPLDIAVLLRGQDRFLIDIKLNPEIIHKLLKKTSEFCDEFAKAREELSEVEWTSIYFGDDFAGFLSPEDFKKFYLPYARSLFQKHKRKNRVCLWHCDAPTEHILEFIPELGIDAFLWPCPDTDLAIYKKKIGDKVTLVGALHPDLLLRGTPIEVEEACRDQIRKGAPGGGYVFSLGGEIIPNTPSNNIEAMIRSVEKYGKLYHEEIKLE
jgi:uroporphyrinogen decarboxylase